MSYYSSYFRLRINEERYRFILHVHVGIVFSCLPHKIALLVVKTRHDNAHIFPCAIRHHIPSYEYDQKNLYYRFLFLDRFTHHVFHRLRCSDFLLSTGIFSDRHREFSDSFRNPEKRDEYTGHAYDGLAISI